ncbi:MAG: Uma2 family endonuclease [Microcoleaceae cyanobacterium]
MFDWQIQQLRFLGRRPILKSLGLGMIAILITLVLPLLHPVATIGQDSPDTEASAAITKETAPFNQFEFYPIKQELPPELYRPTGEWMGRLILPRAEQLQAWQQASQETDWAWLEIYHAPESNKAWQGKIVRLAWSDSPQAQRYVNTATRDVRFTPDVQKSIDAGRMHPVRLNGRDQVGPLQSLAGFRPQDDVMVVLKGEIQVEGDSSATPPAPAVNSPILRISREPVMETGRFVALVQLIEPVAPPKGYSLPSQCPEAVPCTSEFFKVRHYNPATQKFDGAEVTIRVPQQLPNGNGIFFSTSHELEKSPVGQAGWYVYGAQDEQGTFTAQALKPRSLFQLNPSRVVLGRSKALKYIRYQNWDDTPERKGTAQSVLVDAEAAQPETALAEWQTVFDADTPIGTRALLIHLFGSRGGAGKLGEKGPLGTYTGHFAYGLGEVVRDPFTQEPQFDITYVQIYANNGPGIMSGMNTWANYMGNLYRGKMGTHPVSDILVKFDPLTESYTFGSQEPRSPLNELLGELSVVAARYRIGDGTGSALITAATSCVQDSNQALYNTLRRFQQGIEENPKTMAWMEANPDAPDTQRFRQLARLGIDLYNELTPLGVVRWDWDNNADVILGAQAQDESQKDFVSLSQLTLRNTLTGLLTWRTALPRQGHDEISILYLKNGASLWFLRSNQLGGNDPTLYPIAPTLAMGAFTLPFTNFPWISVLLTRIFGAFRIPYGTGWFVTGLAFAIFGAIAYWMGSRSGILRWNPWQAPWYRKLGIVIKLLFVPALLEEFIFRVLLIPEPGRTGTTEWVWWLFALVSLFLYVVSHQVNAQLFYKSARSLFFKPDFLRLCTVLGLTCTIVYRITGSLWTITLIHWLAVVIWILFLGGMQQLQPKKADTLDLNKARFSQKRRVNTALNLSPIGELTDEAFYQLCTANPDLKLERTAQGQLIVNPPTGGEIGANNFDLYLELGAWNKENQLGICFDSSTGFKLPSTATLSPDVSWIRLDRWQSLSRDQQRRFPPLAPDFVIELMSPGDDLGDAQAKMREYMNNGVQLGWLIDRDHDTVKIYRHRQADQMVTLPAKLSGEQVLPGFELEIT